MTRDPEHAELEASMQTFVERDYARVVAAVTLITGSRPAAEDAVQDALATIWSKRATFTPDSLIAWITVAASNRAKTGLRRQRTEERLHPRMATPSFHDTLGPDAVALRAALPALPLRQRQVVVLFYFFGYPVADIATHLSVSDGTVKTSLSRARESLARQFVEPGDDVQEIRS